MISNKDIISLTRDDVIKVAKKLNKEPNYPSDTISRIIWMHHKNQTTEDDIISKNNPLGLINPSDNTILTFNTIEECLLSNEGREFRDDDYESKKKDICKNNKLYGIDKLYLYSLNNNKIDLSEDQKNPKVDQYTVKDGNTTLYVGDSLLDANIEASKNSNSKIYNSKCVIINKDSENKYKVQNAISLTLSPGAAIECKNINLYKTSKSESPIRLINGTYYLYDGIVYNGRLAICLQTNNEININNIFGFINKNQIS